MYRGCLMLTKDLFFQRKTFKVGTKKHIGRLYFKTSSQVEFILGE